MMETILTYVGCGVFTLICLDAIMLSHMVSWNLHKGEK